MTGIEGAGVSEDKQPDWRKAAQIALLTTSAATSLLVSSPAKATGTYGYSNAAERNSGAATTGEVVRSITSTVSSQIAGRVSTAIHSPNRSQVTGDPSANGVATGEQDREWNFWGSLSGTRLDNSLSSTRYHANLETVMAGADVEVDESWLVGLTLVGETAHGATAFNNGAFNRGGASLVPYAAWHLNDALTWTGMAGYGYGTAENGRTFGSHTYAATYDYQRWLASTELAYEWTSGAFSLSPRLGYLYAQERNDSYAESNSSGGEGAAVSAHWQPLGEAKLGMRTGYAMPSGFAPYFQASYLYDNIRQRQSVGVGAPQPSNDPDEFLFQLGLDYQPTDRLSGAVELTQNAGRDHASETTISLNLRLHL